MANLAPHTRFLTVPQSSGDTPLDRAIREQNDRIDNSICNGC